MRNLLVKGLSILLVLFVVGVVKATSPVIIRRIEYQPYYVPAYGASSGSNQQQSEGDVLRQILGRMERIESMLADVLAGKTVAGLTAESILKTNCAKCHTEGSAKGRLRPFLLFDKGGQPIVLSIGDKSNIIGRMESKDPKQVMPQGRPLSEALQGVVIQSFEKGEQK
jgi:hypothetical protein